MMNWKDNNEDTYESERHNSLIFFEKNSFDLILYHEQT